MTRQLWWLVPLTLIWLFGMWLLVLYFRTDAPTWAVVVLLAGNVVTLGIASFVGVRRPEVRIGQLFMLATAGFAVSPFLLPDIAAFVPTGWIDAIEILGSTLSKIALAAICWVVALFPSGRHTSPRWRWISWYLWVFLAVTIPLDITRFAPQGLSESPSFREDAVFGAVMLAFLAAAVSLFVRFRRGDRQTRAQVGWLFYAVAVYATFLFASIPLELQESITTAALDQVFYLPIPIAIGIAVLRYRLYEIDRVVSRTVSYGVVVGVMVLVYLAVVLSLGALLDLGGDTEVALATLAAVAVSVPLLSRVRRSVDRRFFRSRYDSALVVARVADDLRATVDLDEVEQRAGAVIEEVFEPEEVSVWLAGDR